jgi:hypothetical protein
MHYQHLGSSSELLYLPAHQLHHSATLFLRAFTRCHDLYPCVDHLGIDSEATEDAVYQLLYHLDKYLATESTVVPSIDSRLTVAPRQISYDIVRLILNAVEDADDIAHLAQVNRTFWNAAVDSGKWVHRLPHAQQAHRLLAASSLASNCSVSQSWLGLTVGKKSGQNPSHRSRSPLLPSDVLYKYVQFQLDFLARYPKVTFLDLTGLLCSDSRRVCQVMSHMSHLRRLDAHHLRHTVLDKILLSLEANATLRELNFSTCDTRDKTGKLLGILIDNFELDSLNANLPADAGSRGT